MLVPRVFGIVLMGFVALGALAQQGGAKSSSTGNDPAASGQPATAQGADPLKRPLTAEQKKREKKLLKELQGPYKKWLNEDVVYIITDEERSAFERLSNNEERDQFIEQFWLRRDPTPDTVENEYREEHYRRIAYANERFTAGTKGWATDRGRIYIVYGPPDSIDAHASGESTYHMPVDQGGGTMNTFPFEVWTYRHIDGLGENIQIEFVDRCLCNEYRMSMNPTDKDALNMAPNVDLTKQTVPFTQQMQKSEFDRLRQYDTLFRPPPIKFKDLEEVVTHKMSYNLVPFDVVTDFVKVTSDTALVPITLQIKNKVLTFTEKQGVQTAVMDIFGRITTLTGRTAQTFEDVVKVQTPSGLLGQQLERRSVYWKAVPLRAGRYRVDLVVKDVNGDRMGTWSRSIVVPEFSDDRLMASSLIIADDMSKVPSRNVGAGSFVIGDTKVRPRVPEAGKPATFERGQSVNFWMQVYNLGLDEQTHKPSATVEYEVTNLASHKAVVHTVESTQQMGNVGDQLTLAKSLQPGELEPGQYQVTFKIDDKVGKQTVGPTATFVVE